MQKVTIESLVRQAQQGDRDAFAELSLRFEPQLGALAAARMAETLRRKLSVDDVIQETFTRALASIDRFEWQGDGSFLRWLGGIARNVIAHSARNLGVSCDLELATGLAATDASPSRDARRVERLDRFEAALWRLTPEQREALRLSRMEGLKVREVAERLQKSPDAVQQLILRGLKALRRNFGETESLGLPDRPLDLDNRNDLDELRQEP